MRKAMNKAQLITKVADLNSDFNASSGEHADKQAYLEGLISAVGTFTSEDMSLEISGEPTTIQGWPCVPEA